MKKILILDFDGTIINSNFVKKSTIIKHIKEKYKVDISKKIDSFNFQKYTRYELISLAKNEPISSYEKLEIDYLVDESVKNANLDPDLFQLFKFCSRNKIKVILVSNTPHESLKNIVHELKINDYFYKVIGKKHNQDKEDIFSKIIKNESINPCKILSVGDNLNDYFASKKNKIPFHGIHNESLLIMRNKIPITSSLRGVIKSLK